MTLLIVLCLGLPGLFLLGLLLRRQQDFHVPDWPSSVRGLCYAPFRPGQSPDTSSQPDKAQIREDLMLLSSMTRHIRTYSVEGALRYVPEIAEELGLEVTLGIWISEDSARDADEITQAIELAKRYPCVRRILVGNETLYRHDLSLRRLLDCLQHVREQVKIPISTSQQWHLWRDYPELARHVDFIAAHVLPFWEAKDFQQAAAHVLELAAQLQTWFPDQPLLISEVGWPSQGQGSKRLFTSHEEQSISLRCQVRSLEEHGYDYCIIEAFDQPWKTSEGLSGRSWGLFSAERRLKIQQHGPVRHQGNWRNRLRQWLGGPHPDSLGRRRLLLLVGALYLSLLLTSRGQLQALAAALAWPMSLAWAGWALSSLWLECRENLESAWLPEKSRSFRPIRDTQAWRPPVAIHLACHDEPPAMVIQTLDSLASLHYPDFEVLVLDNNTPHPDTWRPVQEHCRRLGPRFRFLHSDDLPGFKAGALNHLLDQTSPEVQVIAVIDADYQVFAEWLYEMVPHLQDPAVALVQSPQDYRDSRESLFKTCCHAEYRGFFNLGMVLRNEHDAIIQHGTMTLIRRSALDAQRWSTACICEDAELGLRLLERGYHSGYRNASYGRGLTPDSFLAFKQQRYRWVYGAMQIIRDHAAALILGHRTQLSAAQRYHFLAGWAAWLLEGCNTLLLGAAVLVSLAMLLWPQAVAAPPLLISAVPVAVFGVRLVRLAYLYRVHGPRPCREGLAATLAGVALYPTIGRAVLAGLCTRYRPFLRTAKQDRAPGLARAIGHAREELGLLAVIWALLGALLLRRGWEDPDMMMWTLMLAVQSLPCLAALAMALLSCWHPEQRRFALR
ncbi:glycosyltransferase family 2 protein [uncultured Pseudomonas sp.]|uniref:glycosyltransferase family 2 protein n=1 Tax=uncultured Pseudomonas sp. TaxID=114707 RepID=UPI0025EBE194|nr:glycosyltransferase family 2 protein [uncultured Pseudomonas sp.]